MYSEKFYKQKNPQQIPKWMKLVLYKNWIWYKNEIINYKAANPKFNVYYKKWKRN